MAAKPRSEWSPAYRRRIERAEARAAARGEPFSKKRARGKAENEYRARKESEARRARVSIPGFAVGSLLTPAEIRQLRYFGASDPEIAEVASLQNRHKLIRDQRLRWRGQLPGIPSREWDPDIPDVLYYYHWQPRAEF